jgi:hypothetical protein
LSGFVLDLQSSPDDVLYVDLVVAVWITSLTPVLQVFEIFLESVIIVLLVGWRFVVSDSMVRRAEYLAQAEIRV